MLVVELSSNLVIVCVVASKGASRSRGASLLEVRAVVEVRASASRGGASRGSTGGACRSSVVVDASRSSVVVDRGASRGGASRSSVVVEVRGDGSQGEPWRCEP